jgi:hypothetical protein
MTKRLLSVLTGMILLTGVQAFGQEELHTRLHGSTAVAPIEPENAAATTTMPMWTYEITASKDSRLHFGKMIGQSIVATTKTTTNIPAVLIPLIVDIGAAQFNPTLPDTCNGSSIPDASLVQFSPIFENAAFTMNGANVGTTQYVDAFQRANFWAVLAGSNYHTLLNLSVGPSVTVPSALTSPGITTGSGCATLGVLSLTPFDRWVRNGLLPALTSAGIINPGTLPVLILSNVVFSQSNPPNLGTCCVLGYHGATGSPVQTYSVAEFDSSGQFGNTSDTAILSHEIGEWVDDPLGSNGTPAWGNVGQVTGCQGNLEVGDPLSDTLFPSVTMPNGFTYHLQELAFFSWFFNADGSASAGAGGKFSNNGTFSGPAKVCPPGGTF